MCTYRDALKQAKDLGAIKVGIYYTRTHNKAEPFTAHFFNAEGTEVGFYNYYLGPLSSYPLVIMDPPRVWGKEALASLSISNAN